MASSNSKNNVFLMTSKHELKKIGSIKKLSAIRLNGWNENTDSKPIVIGVKYKTKKRLSRYFFNII